VRRGHPRDGGRGDGSRGADADPDGPWGGDVTDGAGRSAPSTDELFGTLGTAAPDAAAGEAAYRVPAHAAGRRSAVRHARTTPDGPGPTSGPAGVLAPSRVDPVVRLASQVIGGPAGRRLASATGLWRAASVLTMFAFLVMGLAVLEKQHCRNEGWTSPDQFFHLCYSDIPVLYGSAGLGGPDRPGLVDAVAADGALGQPPLMAALMWTVSAVVPSPTAADAGRTFLDLSAVLLGGALVVAVGCVAAVAGRRRWDAAHLALAPVVVTAGLVSYDLFAVALVSAALLAWSRDRVVAAGVLLGLAVAVRPTLAVVGVVLVAVTLRAGVVGRAGLALAAAAGTYLGVRVVLLPGWSGQLGTAFDGWRGSTPGYGSIWLAPQLFAQGRPAGAGFWYSGDGLGATSATLLSMLGVVAVAVGVVVLALSTRRRPRTAHLALVAVAGCLLVAKSVPVQSSLLLLPFVAWAGLRWRDHLLWASTEALYFVGVWLYIGGLTNTDRAVPAGGYLLLLLLRLGGIAWLGVQGVRAAVDPLRDPVRLPEDRGPGADDPLGGPAADAPDALVVRLA
jgi:hypothetical protein